MTRVKKVRFKAVPVRDTLLQMKDISELMIDLAYSAALFNNKELAGEVIELEEKMDDLVYVLNMNLMLAARDKDDAEALAAVQRVGALTNSISDAAGDIASIVIKGLGVHPIVREVFERTEEKLDRIQISENSILHGKTVDGLHLASRIGADIIAIRRGHHWLINPGKEIIMPEDMVMARGTELGLDTLLKAAKGEIDQLE